MDATVENTSINSKRLAVASNMSQGESVDGWLHASPSGTPSTVTGETSISVIFLMLVSLGRHRFVPF